jgi:hypothetical protein
VDQGVAMVDVAFATDIVQGSWCPDAGLDAPGANIDSNDEFLHAEGALQVVIGPESIGRTALVWPQGQSRHEQNPGLLVQIPDALADLNPLQIGHTDVEANDRRVVFCEKLRIQRPALDHHTLHLNPCAPDG